jgi:hypothetical protein
MNAVATRFCADVKHGITDARRFAKKDLIFPDEPEREGIYKRIKAVTVVKDDFASDRRDPKAIAVMTDAGDAAL